MSGLRMIWLAGFAAVSVSGVAQATEPGLAPQVRLAPAIEQRWIDQLNQPRQAAVFAPVQLASHKVVKKRGGGLFGKRRAMTGADVVYGRGNAGRNVRSNNRNSTRVSKPRTVDPVYLPTLVDFDLSHKPGTIVIDAGSRFLYLVLEDGKARRYGVGVGRDGFGWTGSVSIGRKAEWPGWTPPPEMRKRQPGLPVHMEGGIDNPLGARALYLYKGGRDTIYRIHGSNEPWTIGQAVSSGCFRMRNEDVTDLYQRVGVGTPVVVL